MRNQCTYFFSPPVPKMGSPCGVQALTIIFPNTRRARECFLGTGSFDSTRFEKFHATGVTNQGSKVAQPPHVKICDKQRRIDVGLLVDNTVSTAQKRHTTHNWIKIFQSAFHRHMIVSLTRTALEAASEWWVRSKIVPPAFPTPSMHPNHLCPPDRLCPQMRWGLGLVT